MFPYRYDKLSGSVTDTISLKNLIENATLSLS